MAKVKVLKESELIGGTDNSSVYPITHTKAVFNSDNKELDQILNDIKKKIDTAETNITSNENLIDTLEVSLEATNELADTALRILTFASIVENVKIEEQFITDKFSVLYDIGKNYFVAFKDGKYYISFVGSENFNTTSNGVIKARKDRLFWSFDDDFIYHFDGIKFKYFSIKDYERAKLLAYPAKPLDIPLATENSQGLMSAEDKRKINKGSRPWTDIVWSDHNMNEFTEFGEYYIHGERTDSSDNLPILNAANGHTIEGILKVYDSSIVGTGKNTDKVVTQILSMSNRVGGDGHIWIRTGQGSTKSNLTWSTWEKLQGIFEKNNVTTLEDLDSYTTNGMYSGIYAGTEPKNFYTVQFLPLDTFLMITVNGYAVSKLAVPQITQLLYKLPAKTSTSKQNAEIYLRTGSYNKTDKIWDWGTFTKMITNADLSAQVAILTAKINQNATNIASVTTAASKAITTAQEAQAAATTASENAAQVQELASQAKTDAARAQGTADSARETATAASTVAEIANNLAAEANTKITELGKEVSEIDTILNDATIVGKKNVPMCEDYDTGVNYNTYRSLVFFTSPAANDVEVSSVKVCISRNVNTYDFKVKIIECEIREGDAQPIWITNVSEELQYSFPSVLPSNIEISLTTPFTIHAGKYVAIVSDNDWLGVTDKVQVEKNSASTTKTGMATSYESLAPNKRIANLTSLVHQSAAAGIALYNEGRKLKDFAEKKYVDEKAVEAKEYTDKKIAELDVQTFNTDDAHVISDYNNDIMAHVSNIFFCGDGYIYVPYSANLTSHSETIDSTDEMVAKISKVNLCNISNPIIKTFAKKGEKFGVDGGFHQSDTFAVYDTVLIDKDEEHFATCSVLTPNGTTNCGTYYSTINKNTLKYAENGVQICKLKYIHDGTTYNVDMNVENLLVFAQRITGNASTRFGNYPIITRPIQYDGYIYSYLGGCNVTSSEVNKSFCGAIIRTNDYGQTWEVVASNPSLSYVTNMWEGAVLPYNGKVYCLLRARDSKGRSYNLAMYYDLVSSTWSDTIQLSGYLDGVLVDKMTDPNTGREVGVYAGDARPFIYQRDGYIYLFAQSIPLIKTYWSEHSGQSDGVYRSHVRIYKCDAELNIIEKKSLFGKNGLQYVSLCDVEDKVYFGFTEDKRHFDRSAKGNISIMEFDFL